MPVRRFFAALICLLLIPLGAMATGDLQEVSLSDVPPRPYVYLVSPQAGASYESGAQLTVSAAGSNVAYYEAELRIGSDCYTARGEGETFEHVFRFDQPPTSSATLTVRGYTSAAAGADLCEIVHTVPSPKEELIGKMIALAYDNSRDSRYKFAPAEEDHHIGVCKNFVMRLFDTYSEDYRMLAYPDLPLHMPKNNSKAACAPYDYGIEWRPETAADGSPFEIAAQFKYDASLSKEENAALARELLVQIRKGDFFQIVGYYGGGNGPHSMYIIDDYDPIRGVIRWTDSNMRGKRIDGVRWGYMQFDARNTVDWWVEVFNMPKRGATLYRLRDDLYKD